MSQCKTLKEWVYQYCAIAPVGRRNYDDFFVWLTQRTEWELFARTLQALEVAWVRAKRDWQTSGKPPYNPADWHLKTVDREALEKLSEAADGSFLEELTPIAGGTIASPDEKRVRLGGKRFVFTAAQNNTHLHEDFWRALLDFCAGRDATLYVSAFTYNKAGYRNASGEHEIKSAASGGAAARSELWFDPRLDPFLIAEQVKVADDLVFCAELDILPTAATPLESLRSYTGPNSGIIPHAKVHMLSQATMKNEPAKFLYTTGTVTQRNYLERKAGQVASHHHTFGALYVEIDDDGNWFARQLVADDNGVFYDLDTAYGPGWTLPASDMGKSYVTLGDIHIEKVDHTALAGALDLVDVVRPAGVFIHDLIDFSHRNHHNIKDAHFLVNEYYNGSSRSVEDGLRQGATFLAGLRNRWPEMEIVVVRSNHDQAFDKWLRNTSAFNDPHNAHFWCQANAIKFEGMRSGRSIDMFRWAMIYTGRDRFETIKFLKEDDSFVRNDIEHGMHGHLGPNGAKGNPKGFRAMGRKSNTAHTHTAGIVDGVWTAGTLSMLDLGYNIGPSSWSHSNIITYPSGKRAIVTQKGSKWRATTHSKSET